MTCFCLIESFRVDGTLVHKSWLFSIPIYSPRWLRESLLQKQLGQPSSEQNTTRSKLSLGPPRHLSPATWSWPTNSCIYNSLLTFGRLFYSVRNHPFPVWCDYELHAKPMIGPGASSYYANPLHQFYSISPSLIPYPPCLRLPPPLKVNSVFPFFPSRTVTYVLGADGVRA